MWPIRNLYSVVDKIGGSYGTDITSNASANAKGAYTELEDSTPHIIDLLLINLQSGLARDYLVDIAIGATGSEIIIVSNLLYANAQSSSNFYRVPSQIEIPIHIPAGTRISARCACTTGGSVMTVSAFGTVKQFHSGAIGSGIITVGAVEADTGGTSIADCGGTADTYGAYTEMVSSSTKRFIGMLLGIGLRKNTGARDANFYVDVAVGAEGSEVPIIDRYIFASYTGSPPSPRLSELLPVSIPIGTRISVRYKCSITDATDRLIDIILYGLY